MYLDIFNIVRLETLLAGAILGGIVFFIVGYSIGEKDKKANEIAHREYLETKELEHKVYIARLNKELLELNK